METGWSPKLYSSARQDWGTPQALFDELDQEFCFVLDAAAAEHNHKCPNWIGQEEDSLSSCWLTASQRALVLTSRESSPAVWLNPPYGRSIGQWVEKAYRESLKGLAVVVLLFARTDTKWFHHWAMKAAEIRLIPGRIRFQGADNCAPAPSCLLVFDEARRMPRFTVQDVPRK